MNSLDAALRAAGIYVAPTGRDAKSPRHDGERPDKSEQRPEETARPAYAQTDPRLSLARSARRFAFVLAAPCPRHGAAPGASCFGIAGEPRNFCSTRGGTNE